jgi:hypothetical protein
MGKIKLGMENAKRIFEQLQKTGASEVERALDRIQTRIKDAATVKNLPNLLQGGIKGYNMFSDLQGIYGCYKKWLIAKDDPKGINKAADFMFDSLDFFAGKFCPWGAFYQSTIKACREVLKIINQRHAERRWIEIQEGLEFKVKDNHRKAWHYAFGGEYEDFAKAWFCTKWNTDFTWDGTVDKKRGGAINCEQHILMDIQAHIKDLVKIKESGLLTEQA